MQKSKIRRLMAALVLAGLFSSLAVFSALAGDYPVAVVRNPNAENRLNLRSAPNKDAASLGRYYNGVVVVVYNETNAAWWEVNVGGRQGYMEAKYLTPCGLQSGYDQAVLDRVGKAMPSAVVGGQRPQDGLHLRGRPSEKEQSFGKFYNGTPVQILGVVENGSWYYVYLPQTNNYGYMLAQFVQAGGGSNPADGGNTQPPVTTGYGWAIVNNPDVADRLNLRESASESSVSLGRFYNGTTVKVLSESGAWCKVDVEGKTGYMLARCLLKDSATQPLVILDVGRTIGESTLYQPLHSAPSLTASVVHVPDYQGSAALSILGKAGTWYFVEVNGVQGYYPINRVMPGVRNPGGNAKYAVVTGPNLKDRLDLRVSTSETSASLGLYPVGTQAEVLAYNVNGDAQPERAWNHVRVAGQTGYMRAQYLLDVQRGEPATW